MQTNYFTKIKEQTQTRLWINNPTMPEIESSLAHGAVCCTTNPAYSANMLQRDRDYALSVIKDCLKKSEDDNIVADLVQQRLVVRVLQAFEPTYVKSNGQEGFVSIQGNPYSDDSAAHIIDEARRYRKLGPNLIAKIPATEEGFKAIETLIAEDVPIIATEVFGLSQMIYACELYSRVSNESVKHPAYYITHITGIFDEYLKNLVERENININPDILDQAGLAIARKQYRIFKSRGYPGIMLGGGARGTHHFTDLVGEEMHITVNWSTVEDILKQNPPVNNNMSIKTDKTVIEELLEKLPDFQRGWLDDGLKINEFEDYGPVQLFRNKFIYGWDQLLNEIHSCRS